MGAATRPLQVDPLGPISYLSLDTDRKVSQVLFVRTQTRAIKDRGAGMGAFITLDGDLWMVDVPCALCSMW